MDPKSPARLIRPLSPAQTVEVTRWWASLAPLERRALRADPGRPDGRVIGRFVLPGEPDEVDDELYEYLVNHEILLSDVRTYHVCAGEAAARTAIASGRIPAGFRCPRASATCPMRRILDAAPGFDVALEVALLGSRE
jgi:hypothetical protein